MKLCSFQKKEDAVKHTSSNIQGGDQAFFNPNFPNSFDVKGKNILLKIFSQILTLIHFCALSFAISRSEIKPVSFKRIHSQKSIWNYSLMHLKLLQVPYLTKNGFLIHGQSHFRPSILTSCNCLQCQLGFPYRDFFSSSEKRGTLWSLMELYTWSIVLFDLWALR